MNNIKMFLGAAALAAGILVFMKMLPWAMGEWFDNAGSAQTQNVFDKYARKVCVDGYVFILNTYQGGIVQMFVYEEEGIAPVKCTKNN